MHAHACASAYVEAAEGEDEVQGSRTESVATGSIQRGRRPLPLPRPRGRRPLCIDPVATDSVRLPCTSSSPSAAST